MFVLQRAMVSFRQPLSLRECSPFTFFQQARGMGRSCFTRASMFVLFKAEVSCRQHPVFVSRVGTHTQSRDPKCNSLTLKISLLPQSWCS